jgi:hypothetical protein
VPDVPNSTVNKIEANDSLVFIQGWFNNIGGIFLPYNFAALRSGNGKLDKLFPLGNGTVTALKLDRDQLFKGFGSYK